MSAELSNGQIAETVQKSIAERSPGARKTLEQVREKAEALDKPFEYDTQLYREILDFVEKHVDFVEDIEYDILALKTLETWFYTNFEFLSYVYFIGPPSSGKTKAMETSAALAYHPINAAYMTTPVIYRMLDGGRHSLYLDETQQYLDENKADFLAMLNAGYRKGQKAYIMVRGEKDWEARGFNVYGPKFLASTENTIASLFSRCIPFTMSKNVRRVNLEIDREWAAELRAKIEAYINANFYRKIPDVKPMFDDYGIRDYRTTERFINLVALCPPEYRNRLMEYIKQIDLEIMENEEAEFYGELVDAILFAWEKGKPYREGLRKIWIRDIAETYDDGRQEKTDSKQIGWHVRNMGLTRTCRDKHGVGRIVSERYIKRLKHRYRPPKKLAEF